MPVCTDCGRYWSPRNAAGGECRECGGRIAGAALATDVDAAPVKERLPWHLKLLGVSFTLYMGWRIVQGVQWLIRHL